MTKNGVTFAELRNLLVDLGFSECVEPARIAFTYSPTGTYLLLRTYAAKERVSDRDLLVVRRQLLENGLIEPATLDRLLHKASA